MTAREATRTRVVACLSSGPAGPTATPAGRDGPLRSRKTGFCATGACNVTGGAVEHAARLPPQQRRVTACLIPRRGEAGRAWVHLLEFFLARKECSDGQLL